MLVQFAVENFQSIKNRVVLDMRKMNITEHKDTLIEGEYLPVSVIYGPNGGGKSTVLRALGMVFAVITNPVRVVTNKQLINVNPAVHITPFLLDNESKNKPTVFELVFKLNDNQYRLVLEILDDKIIYESLEEKGPKGKAAKLYEREENIITIGEKLKFLQVKQLQLAENMPVISMLKLLYNVSPIKDILDWALINVAIDYGQPRVEELIKGAIPLVDRDDALKIMSKQMLKYLNLGIDDYELEYSDETKSRFRVKTIHKINNEVFELRLGEESMGTQKVFNLLPFIIESLRRGGVIIVDELDAKLHPKMLARIIGLFTNKDNNPKGAQLVFTSHDLSTMNSDIFRRDEIWFAAKDKEESTDLYSLADIRGLDGDRVRLDAAYSKQYLVGRYGADPYFDSMAKWGQ